MACTWAFFEVFRPDAFGELPLPNGAAGLNFGLESPLLWSMEVDPALLLCLPELLLLIASTYLDCLPESVEFPLVFILDSLSLRLWPPEEDSLEANSMFWLMGVSSFL